MKELLHTFLALPTWEGILLIVAGVGLLCAAILIASRVSYHAGERHAEMRFERVTRQRRQLSSIQL